MSVSEGLFFSGIYSMARSPQRYIGLETWKATLEKHS